MSETAEKLLAKVDCDAALEREGLKLAEERPEYPGLSSLITVQTEPGRGRFAVADKGRARSETISGILFKIFKILNSHLRLRALSPVFP